MTKDLTKGNPFRVIISYLIPVFFSLLLQTLYSVTDAAIVGQTLGADALGGISATGNLNSVTLGIFTGLNSGFCIPISNAFGAGDHSRLRKCVANGAYLCAGAAAFSAYTVSNTAAETSGFTPAYSIKPSYLTRNSSAVNGFCVPVFRSKRHNRNLPCVSMKRAWGPLRYFWAVSK